MAIVLGPNQYGKAETHVVRVYRDTDRHEIRDLLVSTALRGDFEAAHVTGDQSAVLPTDTQKNTAFAFAKDPGVGAIEEYALVLARHFVTSVGPVLGARVNVVEYPWDRIEVDGHGHDHAFVRRGGEVHTAAVAIDVDGAGSAESPVVESGLADLTVLKSTGSEFRGFLRDRYTTLADADDRILATSLDVHWRYATADVDWDASRAAVRATLLDRFATTHSLALQHTLWEMGRAALEDCAEVAEIRLKAPNKHHVAVELEPFGLDNPGEVFYAADRPYGLIEATVRRDDPPR